MARICCRLASGQSTPRVLRRDSDAGSRGNKPGYDGLGGVVVVPDGGSQGGDALQDPGEHAGRGVPAVTFQVKLAFERVVDRFDDLAQRPEEPGAWPLIFAFAGRPEQDGPCPGQGGLEVVPVVVLVADDDAANSAFPCTRSNASAGATTIGASGGSRCRPAANNQACSWVASTASYSPAEHSLDTSDR
jgi:hypothetical protein